MKCRWFRTLKEHFDSVNVQVISTPLDNLDKHKQANSVLLPQLHGRWMDCCVMGYPQDRKEHRHHSCFIRITKHLKGQRCQSDQRCRIISKLFWNCGSLWDTNTSNHKSNIMLHCTINLMIHWWWSMENTFVKFLSLWPKIARWWQYSLNTSYVILDHNGHKSVIASTNTLPLCSHPNGSDKLKKRRYAITTMSTYKEKGWKLKVLR